MANIYILGPLTLWVVAQLLKFSINLVRGKADVRYLISSGGMPSAHAAVVCSLATIALLDSGVNSAIFGVSAVLAAIVMYDSFGVRRSSGEQAQLINRMVGDLQNSGALRNASDYVGLREILGHKPFEVAVGAILGIVGGIFFVWDKAQTQLNWIISSLSNTQLLIANIVLAVFISAGIAIYISLRRMCGKPKNAKKLINSLLRWHAAATAVLVLLLASAYQHVSILDDAWFIILTWVFIIGAMTSYYIVQVPKLKGMTKIDDDKLRRDKWLTKTKRKK